MADKALISMMEEARELAECIDASSKPGLRTVRLAVLREAVEQLASRWQRPVQLLVMPELDSFSVIPAERPFIQIIVEQYSRKELLEFQLSSRIDIRCFGGTLEDLRLGFWGRLLHDLKSLRRAAAAGLGAGLALLVLLASDWTSEGLEAGRGVAGLAATVASLLLATFTFFASQTRAYMDSTREPHDPNCMKSLHADRVVLGWITLSVGLSAVGYLLTWVPPLPFASWNLLLQATTTAVITLGIAFLGPPLVDVIPFMVGRHAATVQTHATSRIQEAQIMRQRRDLAVVARKEAETKQDLDSEDAAAIKDGNGDE